MIVGGVSATWWVAAFRGCSKVTGAPKQFVVERTAWPDGAGYMEQEEMVVSMFGLIQDETARTLNRG